MTAVAIALKLRFSVKHGLLSRCGLCVKSLGRLSTFNHVSGKARHVTVC